MKSSIIACALLGLFFVSCKKEKEDTGISDRERSLTSGSWTYQSYRTLNLTTNVETNVLSSIPACSRDNQMVFSMGGRYEGSEGATKCNPASPQIIQAGNWSLTDNENSLRIEITEGNGRGLVTYDIISLTDTEMILDLELAGELHRLGLRR